MKKKKKMAPLAARVPRQQKEGLPPFASGQEIGILLPNKQRQHRTLHI